MSSTASMGTTTGQRWVAFGDSGAAGTILHTDDGYAVRRPSETDGRSTLIAISDQGREVLLADRRRRDAWLARQLGLDET